MTLLAMPTKSPAATPQRAIYVSAALDLGFGYFVMIHGRPKAWFYHELRAQAEADVLNELAASVVLDCATKVVQVAADFAAAHQGLCHDCERTCLELGEEARKKLMEETQ